MKCLQRPVPATILYGMIFGLSFILSEFALNLGTAGLYAVGLILWLSAAGYAFLLCRWSRQKLPSIAFPILLLFLTVFLVDSNVAYFLLVLAVISWIRSGICFPQNGAMVTSLTPGSVLGWASIIWMIYLMQALYFVIFENKTDPAQCGNALEIDSFERASRRAQDILSSLNHI